MCDRPDEGYSRKGLRCSESDFRLFRVWSEGLFPKQRREQSGQTKAIHMGTAYFLPGSRWFPAQNFKGNYEKRTLTHKIYEDKLNY